MSGNSSHLALKEAARLLNGRMDQLTAQRSRIVHRLQSIVNAVITQNSFRRLMQSRAPVALAKFGFCHSSIPSQLTVPSKVSVYYDDETVFGIQAEPSDNKIPVDIRLVSYGAKPVALHYGPADLLGPYAGWAQSQSLVSMLSPFDGLPVAFAEREGLGDEIGQRPAKGPGGYRGLIVASSESQAMLAWLSLLFGWHHLLGRLLNVPSCCCTKNRNCLWACRSDEGIGLDSLAFPPSGIFDWHYNVFGGHLGYQLLCHFPCSFDCRESLAAALWHLSHLRNHDPSYAELLPATLRSVVVMAGRCVCLLPGASVRAAGEDGFRIDYMPEKVRSNSFSSSFANVIRKSSVMMWRGDELFVANNCLFGCSCWIFTGGSGSADEKTFSRVSSVPKKRRREFLGFFPRIE